MMATVASIISLRLCGGMLVVIPTAIPVEPFIRRPLEGNDRVGYMQICGWAGAGGKKFA